MNSSLELLIKTINSSYLVLVQCSSSIIVQCAWALEHCLYHVSKPCMLSLGIKVLTKKGTERRKKEDNRCNEIHYRYLHCTYSIFGVWTTTTPGQLFLICILNKILKNSSFPQTIRLPAGRNALLIHVTNSSEN